MKNVAIWVDTDKTVTVTVADTPIINVSVTPKEEPVVKVKTEETPTITVK